MRLRPALLALLLAVCVAALGAGPASAILGGQPDGTVHPAVGGLVADQQYSDGTWLYCSGSLIAPQVFLTAAHCAEGGGDRVRVSFSPAYHEGDRVYAGTFRADPAYGANGAASDPHDIAVVLLDEPVIGITPVRLPQAGSLGSLRSGTTILGVGYGATGVTQGGKGGHGFTYDDVRMAAAGTLNAVTPVWLRISENPARSDGGGCYGDSGGPNFLGSSDVEAATTISGDATCRATNVAYRLDTPSARAFLGQFVPLP